MTNVKRAMKFKEPISVRITVKNSVEMPIKIASVASIDNLSFRRDISDTNKLLCTPDYIP